MLVALVASSSCTDRNRAALPVIEPDTVAPAPGRAQLNTLPPVGEFTYSHDPTAIVAQISVNNEGLDLPLLTVYGGGRAISLTDDGWLIGAVTDFAIQQFLNEAESFGLLDGSLSLRGPDVGEVAQISAQFNVDGETITHELDLSQIERPPDLRAFLQRSATSNPFELTATYDPGTWITCARPPSPMATALSPIVDASIPACSIVAQQATPSDRPLLPHEPDPAALIPN